MIFNFIKFISSILLIIISNRWSYFNFPSIKAFNYLLYIVLVRKSLMCCAGCKSMVSDLLDRTCLLTSSSPVMILIAGEYSQYNWMTSPALILIAGEYSPYNWMTSALILIAGEYSQYNWMTSPALILITGEYSPYNWMTSALILKAGEYSPYSWLTVLLLFWY